MVGQIGQSSESQRWSTSLHILGDDSLLKIFKHRRPVFPDEGGADKGTILNLEERGWDHERWWYQLAHVCRRWRCLLLTSASHLDLCLFFTHGTPVVDMLTHSPPFPLVIDYGEEDRDVTVEDEEGILLALQRRRRVRRIRLRMPTLTLRKLVVSLNGEFPMLEYLYIKPLTDDDGLILPETFRAPHLRHFTLINVTYSPSVVHLPLVHPTPRVQSAEGVSQCVRCGGSQIWRSLKMFIHILDDDSLLNIFYLCRPFLLDEDEWDPDLILRGRKLDRERWWYKLAHVCRRWRYLILASASHLDLSLLCTHDTPVADMLAHSPPFPLIIDYLDEFRNTTAEDESGIDLALHHRDRVRRIRLQMTAPDLERFILSMDEDFPILEYLYIAPPRKHNMRLILPETFQAPHLRHLILINLAIPIGSPLLTTAVGLVTLSLLDIHTSAYVHPHDLLQRLSLMPQLETLGISFHSPIPNHEVETRLMPITTHATLPNLRWFSFGGASAYLEAILPHITAPLLEKLHIGFFGQLTFSVPCLQQFMDIIQNIRLTHVIIQFYFDVVLVLGYARQDAMKEAFYLRVGHEYLDWQVASVAQLLNALGTAISAVESLVLQVPRESMMERSHEADHTQWHALLMPFNNVKTLRVVNGGPFDSGRFVDGRRFADVGRFADGGHFADSGHFLTQLSDFLELHDRESPMELLPELKELCSPDYYVDDIRIFSSFLDGRKNAGRPVNLVPSWARLNWNRPT